MKKKNKLSLDIPKSPNSNNANNTSNCKINSKEIYFKKENIKINNKGLFSNNISYNIQKKRFNTT